MKILSLFLLVFSSSLSASVYSQNQRISINANKTSVANVFNEIRNVSEFTFIYNTKDVESLNIVSVNLQEASVNDILDLCLKNTDLTYQIEDKVIIISHKIKENIPQEKKQQEGTLVTGTVTDEKGETLPGVSITIKGTKNGVTTNDKGRYFLTVRKGDIMIFSFVGMIEKEIKYNGQKPIDVTLQDNASKLEEVVITGYGEVEKRKLSSSVVTISAGVLKEGNSVDISNMLQGKVAGLSIIGSTSTVGVSPKIRIRGISSISGNREPLWVVDGVILDEPVPLSSAELNSLDNVNLIGNAISSINPEDIERIDVLKDASATAIYGTKAANGVIVVTTKQGREGAPEVRYSSSYTISERPDYADLNRMNSKERIDVSKEIVERGLSFRNDPAHVAYEGLLYDYNAKLITYEEFQVKVAQLEQQNTDWFDLLYRTAVSNTQGVTVSGANKKINYYFSGSYTDNNGTFKDNSMTQFNMLSKIGMQLTPKLSLNTQLRAYTSDKEYQHSSINPYQYAYNTSRAIAAYNPDGSYSYYNEDQGYIEPLKYNILNELDNSGQTIENQSFNLNINTIYNLTSDLSLDALFSYNRSNTYQNEWFNEKTFIASTMRMYPYGLELPSESENETFYKNKCSLPYGGMLSNNNTKNTSWTARATARYNKNITPKNNISIVAGTEFRSTQYDGISTKGYGYLPDRGKVFVSTDLIKFPLYRALISNNANIITDRETNVVSFFGTFTYSYDKRYIANFNVRADGSNKFGQDDSNKFLPIWSVSGRWNVKEESFFKYSEWLDQLSFRASYGIQGNISPDATPNLIINLGTMDPLSGKYASSLNKLPNPFLRWEKTKSYNGAVDFSVIDGRISGSFDLYYKKGEDMIVSKQVSTTTGSNTMDINAGNLENKGFDLTLNLIPLRTKNWQVSLSINGGKNENKVTQSGISTNYSYTDYITGRVILPGQALNTFYSYKFDKLNEKGLPTFKDTDEEVGATEQDMYDKVFSVSGNRTADITGGFSLSVKYKSFSIDGNFSYSLGSMIRLNDLYKSSGQYLPRPQQNMDDIFVNRWRKPGDELTTNIPTISENDLTNIDYTQSGRTHEISKNMWEMYNKSDLRVASGDFLKLRNLSFKHYVPMNTCKLLHVSAISLKLDITNIFTIKDSKLRGQDPEQMSFGFGAGSTPPTSSYTLGINVTF